MDVPFFYVPDLSIEQNVITLPEETSRHITQVLRMKMGEGVQLTNGKGIKAAATIIVDHRKRCEVKVAGMQSAPLPPTKVAIAISLLKNTIRFEWFLEKATELGVYQIIPTLCARTEKEKFRADRLHSIMVSAMLQSQQCWLPLLAPPTPFVNVLGTGEYARQYIAHCLPDEKKALQKNDAGAIILIGPEGDFTPAEIEEALQFNYQPVTLGANRLRTETAGVAAAVLLCT